MYNVVEQPVWSSRGELAMGSGVDCKLYPGSGEHDPVAEPWELERTLGLDGTSQHLIGVDTGPTKPQFSRDNGLASGENKLDKIRGANTRTSSLSAARLTKGRTFSPASIRQYSRGQADQPDTARTFTGDIKVIEDINSPPLPQTTTRLLEKTALENDISMMMKSRVIRGYGLFNVKLTLQNVSEMLISSFQIGHNVSVIEDKEAYNSVLAGIWDWLRRMQQISVMLSWRY